MASEKQGSNKVPDWAGGNKSTGVKLDGGPYIGLIKNNSDPARQGRLAVWLPDVGGDDRGGMILMHDEGQPVREGVEDVGDAERAGGGFGGLGEHRRGESRCQDGDTRESARPNVAEHGHGILENGVRHSGDGTPPSHSKGNRRCGRGTTWRGAAS